MASIWTPQLNVALGTLVVGIGAWLSWESISVSGAILIMVCVAVFLLWRGRTVGLVWAWSTLFLGIESFTWPITTMVQIRSTTTQPSDEQMGTILSAVLMGLFSAVFWTAFSYGLFKRAGEAAGNASLKAGGKQSEDTPAAVLARPRKKR